MKRARSEPVQTEGAVVVNSSRSFRVFYDQHRTMLVLLAVIIVAFLAFVGWKWTHRSTVPPEQLNMTAVEDNASAVTTTKGVQAGLAVYTSALEEASDKNVQADIELQAATLALNNNLLNTALTNALKADAIMHSVGSSSLAATIYQKRGNNAQAAIYYEKAANEVPAHQLSGYTKQYYLEQAQALGGKQ